ncbi:MAG: hypothetical protein H8E31_14220 [Planctomycetes bacterium]|nr:hypothetical protein [Planctomycetota bacterium]
MSGAGGWGARDPVLGAEMEDMKQRILDWVLLEPGRFSVEALARRLAWLPGVSQDPAFAAGSFRSCLARAMCRRLLLEARLAEADGTLWPPHGKPPVACRMQPRPAPWQLGAALKLPGEDPCRSLAAASRLERCLCRS